MMQAVKVMKTSTLTMSSTGICESFIPNSVYTQCVRWKRKPIWLPTAKSKVFRVPKRPVIPVEDKMELQRLYNNYRTYLLSFRSHLIEAAKENEVQYDEELLKQAEEEDFRTCSAMNDKWNAEVAKQREVRLAEDKQALREQVLHNLLQIEENQEKKRQHIDERIRKAKMEAVSFITVEGIDAAIEECLANVVNHNRALDLEGNWYEGEYPPVPNPKEAKESTVAE